MIHKPSTTMLLSLVALSIAGGITIYLATSRMGPGVSTDSAMIMATAENFWHGRGLVDYSGIELTQFPPLYSLILGMGSVLFRQDVFAIGWMLNILVFGGLVWLVGQYVHEAFPDEPILAIAGSLVILTSRSLIEISANIASDPLFIVIVVLFLLSASAHLKSVDTRYAILLGVVTIIACFQRYAGLALVISGSVVVAYKNRNQISKAVVSAVLFSILTAAPIFAWGYFHNAPINGTAFGARLPAVPLLNFATGVEKVLYWFIPYRIISTVGSVYLLAVLTLACAALIRQTGAARFLGTISQPAIIPNLIFLLVYFSVLIFNISYYELKGLKTDRVHIVALPSLLMLLCAIGSNLLQAARGRFGTRATYWTAMILLVIWSFYPISKSSEYVRESMRRGDISSYNSINKGDIQISSLAKYLRGLALDGKNIYSNGGDTVWLILRTQVLPSPRLETMDRASELQQRHKEWPGADKDGYLVWLQAEAHKTGYATPAELSSVAGLRRLYSDQNATVYSIESR